GLAAASSGTCASAWAADVRTSTVLSCRLLMIAWTDALGNPEASPTETLIPTTHDTLLMILPNRLNMHSSPNPFRMATWYHTTMHPDEVNTFLKLWLKRLWVIAMALLLVYLCYQPDVSRLRHHNPTTT